LHLHLTDHLKLRMKFIILASLFVISVADPQWNNAGSFGNFQSGMTYIPTGMNSFHGPYNGRMMKREAESDAQWTNTVPYGNFQTGRSFGNFQSGMSYIPTGMNNFHGPYNGRINKREAESDAQWTNAVPYGNFQTGRSFGNFQSGMSYIPTGMNNFHGPYNGRINKREAQWNNAYPYTSYYGTYPFNYNGFNRFYQY
jgi:hypothetical protein